MLASSTCCSLWTGTTTSTTGPAGARVSGTRARVRIPPMVGPAPWGSLGRAWEVPVSSGGGVGGQGEDHPEARSPAGDAVDLHGPAVDGDEGGHDGQPETGAAGRPGARLVGPVEALEHPLGLLGGEPRAVVDDLDGGARRSVEGRGHDPDLDRAAGRGVGEGVVDQVGQHLAQPLVVAEHDQGAPAVEVAQDQLDRAVGGDGSLAAIARGVCSMSTSGRGLARRRAAPTPASTTSTTTLTTRSIPRS